MVPPRLAKGVARHLPRDIDAASVPCLDAEATYSLAGRRVWLRPADLSGPGSLRRKAIRAERDQMPDSPRHAQQALVAVEMKFASGVLDVVRIRVLRRGLCS